MDKEMRGRVDSQQQKKLASLKVEKIAIDMSALRGRWRRT